MKRYLLASDFDQTLSFNDSGIVLSDLLGLSGFQERPSRSLKTIPESLKLRVWSKSLANRYRFIGRASSSFRSRKKIQRPPPEQLRRGALAHHRATQRAGSLRDSSSSNYASTPCDPYRVPALLGSDTHSRQNRNQCQPASDREQCDTRHDGSRLVPAGDNVSQRRLAQLGTERRQLALHEAGEPHGRVAQSLCEQLEHRLLLRRGREVGTRSEERRVGKE